jgi:hypothetical protein
MENKLKLIVVEKPNYRMGTTVIDNGKVLTSKSLGFNFFDSKENFNYKSLVEIALIEQSFTDLGSNHPYYYEKTKETLIPSTLSLTEINNIDLKKLFPVFASNFNYYGCHLIETEVEDYLVNIINSNVDTLDKNMFDCSEKEIKLKNVWQFYKNVDFDYKGCNSFHIDTRDFHVLMSSTTFNNLSSIKKYDEKFFYTKEELIKLLDYLFEKSGGEKEWRMLSFEGIPHINNWNLKYIRVFKHENKFIVCNKNSYALRKDLFDNLTFDMDIIN